MLWIYSGLLFLQCGIAYASTWAEWWKHDGVSGPKFWGRINPMWRLCEKGNKQSPVNITTDDLLFDPNLRRFHVSKHRVNGTLENNGHDIRIRVQDSETHFVNISGGPLQYHYRVSDIVIRFGHNDSIGSEHAIDNCFYSAEIQIMGWNCDIYENMTEALQSSNGLVAIALLAKVGDKTNLEFDTIARHVDQVKYKGQQLHLKGLSVAQLITSKEEYITYEGSLTYPACQETVTWIIPNKPFYVSTKDLESLRQVMTGSRENMRQSMENNVRKLEPLNNRPIRTNINFLHTSEGCTMERKTYYQGTVLKDSVLSNDRTPTILPARNSRCRVKSSNVVVVIILGLLICA